MFIGGSLIGGATELLELVERDGLGPLLAESAGGEALPPDLRAAVERSDAAGKVTESVLHHMHGYMKLHAFLRYCTSTALAFELPRPCSSTC